MILPSSKCDLWMALHSHQILNKFFLWGIWENVMAVHLFRYTAGFCCVQGAHVRMVLQKRSCPHPLRTMDTFNKLQGTSTSSYFLLNVDILEGGTSDPPGIKKEINILEDHLHRCWYFMCTAGYCGFDVMMVVSSGSLGIIIWGSQKSSMYYMITGILIFFIHSWISWCQNADRGTVSSGAVSSG